MGREIGGSRSMVSASGIHVTVKFFALLREIVGAWRVKLPLPEGATVGEALKALAQQYGQRFRDYVYDEEGRVRGHLIFLINGESIKALRGFETVLREGDTLVILPPVGGG
ncbi:MoaD/ThiS family protein [Candidatus Bathyarchaeota archaeon]|nr:MAG: MoaD/ThiS family protein [Candidatus Bathyarchaeota archaeon]